jgi:hypothetical protein
MRLGWPHPRYSRGPEHRQAQQKPHSHADERACIDDSILTIRCRGLLTGQVARQRGLTPGPHAHRDLLRALDKGEITNLLLLVEGVVLMPVWLLWATRATQ